MSRLDEQLEMLRSNRVDAREYWERQLDAASRRYEMFRLELAWAIIEAAKANHDPGDEDRQ